MFRNRLLPCTTQMTGSIGTGGRCRAMISTGSDIEFVDNLKVRQFPEVSGLCRIAM